MARQRRPCHASSARCSQNLPFRMPCRQGCSRSSTRAGAWVGCPTGHRPCVDRNCHPIGCCRSRDRPRAIRPDCLVGIWWSIVSVAAKTSRMIPRPATFRKLSIPRGSEHPGLQRVVVIHCPMAGNPNLGKQLPEVIFDRGGISDGDAAGKVCPNTSIRKAWCRKEIWSAVERPAGRSRIASR